MVSNAGLTLELGYEPSVSELAEALEMSEDKVMEIMQIAREPASLETPIGEEDDSNLGDFVADSFSVAKLDKFHELSAYCPKKPPIQAPLPHLKPKSHSRLPTNRQHS